MSPDTNPASAESTAVGETSTVSTDDGKSAASSAAPGTCPVPPRTMSPVLGVIDEYVRYFRSQGMSGDDAARLAVELYKITNSWPSAAPYTLPGHSLNPPFTVGLGGVTGTTTGTMAGTMTGTIGHTFQVGVPPATFVQEDVRDAIERLGLDPVQAAALFGSTILDP